MDDVVSIYRWLLKDGADPSSVKFAVQNHLKGLDGLLERDIPVDEITESTRSFIDELTVAAQNLNDFLQTEVEPLIGQI